MMHFASLLLRNRYQYGISETIATNAKNTSSNYNFSYAERPRDKSTFSNPVLLMVLTTIDYILQIKPLSVSIMNDMISILKEYCILKYHLYLNNTMKYS